MNVDTLRLAHIAANTRANERAVTIMRWADSGINWTLALKPPDTATTVGFNETTFPLPLMAVATIFA